jgi:DNA-binding NarL/FixJ family response regulator
MPTRAEGGRSHRRRTGGPRGNGRRIVLLGGSEALTTEALIWMLTAAGHRVVASFPSLRSLAEAPRSAQLAPEVVMADIEDPAIAPTVVSQLRRSYPQAKLLLLCDSLAPQLVRCVLGEQVDGVVLKSDSAGEVMVALGHVLRGQTVMPVGWRTMTVSSGVTPLDSLGGRAREILQLAAQGLTNNEIAAQLTISPNTVKFHLRTAYARLGVRNRVEAARLAGYSPVRLPGTPGERLR